MNKQINMGCKAPKVDLRDYKLPKAGAVITALPSTYICSSALPQIKNQKQVNSCVAHATSSILEFHDRNTKTLSTNFIYGIQKKLFGHSDQGMYLKDACKIAQQYGDMLEVDCPGNTEVPQAHTIAEKAFLEPVKMNKAKEYKLSSYYSCNTQFDTKRAIYQHGPVLASIKWYTNFKVNKDGELVGALDGDYGYHAVVVYGWNESGFLCQNSWGDDWGNKGRFLLPYYIGLAEAKGLIDWTKESDTEELIKPAKNSFMDAILKILSSILNLFKKK